MPSVFSEQHYDTGSKKLSYEDSRNTGITHHATCIGCISNSIRTSIHHKYTDPALHMFESYPTSEYVDVCYSCGKHIYFHKLDQLTTEQAEQADQAVQATTYTLDAWIDKVWTNAESHGFHTTPINIDQRIMLIIGELSEFHEHLRNGANPTDHWIDPNGKPDGPAVELADVQIRLWDLIGDLNFEPNQFEQIILAKHDYNVTRPFKHGKEF